MNQYFILLTGEQPKLIGPFTSHSPQPARAFAEQHGFTDYQIIPTIKPDYAAKMAGVIKALAAGTLQV